MDFSEIDSDSDQREQVSINQAKQLQQPLVSLSKESVSTQNNQQQYHSDEEQKEDVIVQPNEQDLIKQMQNQLNDLLNELDLKDASQIQQEIQDVSEEITKLEKKGQDKKVPEKKNQLQKLQEAQQYFVKMQNMKNQISNTKNQKQENKLQKELQTLLEELDIQAEQIPQEIEEVKFDIQKYLQKDQQKKASDSQVRLDKLNSALKKYQELKGETHIDQSMSKQKQLEEILQELDLKDVNQIESEIEDIEEEIAKLQKKGQDKKVLEKKQILEKLNCAKIILEELRDEQKQAGNSQNQREVEKLRNELNLLLEELDIEKAEQIQQEIEDVKQDIQKFLQKQQQKKVNDSQIKLDKLNAALKKYQELLKLQGETQIDQSAVKQQQLEEILRELDLKDANEIESEIKDTEDEIAKLQSQGKEKKALEKKQTLEKLNHAKKILKELRDAQKQAGNTQNQIEEEKVERQLNQLLEELEIENAEQIQQEIEDVKQDIEKFLQKKQQKKISESQIKLDQLNAALKKYQELLKLRKETHIDQSAVKKQQLEELLQELDLQDANEIETEIQETEDEIAKLQNQGKEKKAFEKKQTLEKLHKAKKIIQELSDIEKQAGNASNLSQEEKAKEELNLLLQELDIEKAEYIQQEIEDVKKDIEKFLQKKQQKKVSESQIRLDKLNIAQNKYQELCQQDPKNLNNSDIKQQEKEIEVSSVSPQNQPIHLTKRFTLDDIIQDIKQMPESSEKYLLEMLEICLNLQQQTTTPQTDQGEQQLSSQIDKIEKRLKLEELNTTEINVCIQNIIMNIKQENLEAVIDETDKILKKIRPLNINEMKRLMQEADKAAKMIEGQEVILLLGGTGAGKSTTIHFLAGSVMSLQEVEVQQGSVLTYIAPKFIKNNALKKIKVGYQATSETRFITPVNINFKDVGMSKNGSIILCDSPGFEDTAGPEVDIANGLGIVEAIKLCKSVRPVILLSFKSMGDRGQGIKQLAHILVGFVKQIEDKLSSFSYLFSKFPENYNINSELINIKKSLDQNAEEKSDKAFVSLFEDMIDKTSKSCNKINPINGNPSEILKILINEEGIQEPSQVFKFSITTNSHAAILDFNSKTQQAIILALNRGEYNLIEYKLDEIKFLIDKLHQDSTIQVYNYCVDYIKGTIKKEYDIAIEQLTQHIQNNNKLDTNYLKQYQELIQKFQSIKKLKDKHLGTNVISAEDLREELKYAVQKLSESFDQQNITNDSLVNKLNNINLISEYFTEVKVQYQEVCSKISLQIQKTLTNCNQELQNKNFDRLVDEISLVKQHRKLFQNHIDDQPILDELEKIKDNFKNMINQACQDANDKVTSQQLKEEDIKVINEQIILIEMVEKNQLLCQHINIDYVKDQKSKLFKSFLNQFEQISIKIEEILRKTPEQAFQQLEGMINQMNQLRKIKGLEGKTADVYYKCITEIQSLMQQIKRDVEQLLSDFQHDKKKVDFQKIYRCLNQLKCAEWMNDVNKGAYDSTIMQISLELYKYCQFEIVQKFSEIDLSYKNFKNIQVASELLKELDLMILFEEYNPKLKDLRENASKMFKRSVEVVFDQVREFINPSYISNSKIQIGDQVLEKQDQDSSSQDQDKQKSEQEITEEATNKEKYKIQVEKSNQKQIYSEESLMVKLDGSKTEDFLNYIRACCLTKYVKDEANVILEQLKQFLVRYSDLKDQQIKNNYEIVIDLKEENEKKKTQSALQLASVVQEIIEIQKYEEASQLIKAAQLIQDLKSKMQQYYVELSHDMNQTDTDKQFQSKNINISKLLSHVDNVFGENKFFNLYKSQQNAMNNEFKDSYKNILQAIEKNDFKSVAIDLMAIDENPLNKKALSSIKSQLQYQIENLLEQVKLDALQLGNLIEKDIIMKTTKNIDQIKKAKQSLKDYLDSAFYDSIDDKIDQTITKIDQKIYKYIESIKALLKQADFFEVEEKREHLTQILQLLAGYSKDEKNLQALDDLQKNLEDKVTEITKTSYEEEKDFIFHPPKQILEKLSKVSGRNPKYAECYTSLQQKLIDKIRGQIVSYSVSDQSQQNQQILKVETLMNSVPEELQQILRDQFDNSKQQNEQKKKNFEEQFSYVKQEDLNQKIKYLEDCKNEKMPIFESRMRKLIQEECQNLFKQFQEDMENGNQKEGIQQAIKLLDYNEKLQNDEKIKENFEKVQNQIKEEMKNKVNNLKCIQKFESSEQYEKEYDQFLNLLQTIKDYKDYFLSDEFGKNFEEFCSNVQNFIVGIFNSYEEDLKEGQVQILEKDIEAIKKWENLVNKIKKDVVKTSNLNCFEQLPKMLETIQQKSSSLKECMDKLANFLSESKQGILNFNFVQDIDKNSYYRMIQKSLQSLKQANEAKIDFKDTKFEPECYETECIPVIKKKIEEEEKKAEEALDKQDECIQDRDYKQINTYYENIDCFKKNVNIENPQIKIDEKICKINDKIAQKIENIENNIELESIDTVVQNIIQIKKHSQNLHPFKKDISNKLENFLKNKYFKDKETKAERMSKLANHLQKDENGYGAAIIEESEIFKGVSLSIFNETTQKHGIDYILEHLRGDELEKDRLRDLYTKFETEYQEIVSKKLVMIENKTKTDKEIIEDLVAKIKIKAGKKVTVKNNAIQWDSKLRQNLPSLMAHIFSIWTLLNTQYFQEAQELDNKQNYLLKPHAGQVISIFRLIGLGYQTENLYNNLVQLGTGEGKSVILAITSIIFTLYDIDIYCACYSEYLSQRDYSNFLQLFNILGVTPNIKYGIFNKICEQIINENGQIRDLAIEYISNGFSEEKSRVKGSSKEKKPKILLIDEVDVFFSQDFYGKLYNPIARLQDQSILDLAEFIWKKRNNHLPLKSVQETDSYKVCISKFKNLDCIIDEAIKDMISDSKNFQHNYVVQNRQIGYQEQDSISFDITYGYKTLFAYFYERDQGRVSEEKLRENTFISIKCGSFSYSEIPFKFNCIVGVTGTLETLSKPEKNIVNNIYNITKNTYIPSVFGQNKRKFAEKSDVHVENKEDYFKVLREEINKKLDSGSSQRAVLVFFDSKQSLNKFYESPELSDIKMDVQVITEELSTQGDKKQQLILNASISGQVSLLTASFGRGTDFICRDQRVLKNDGVHVIQTFYSNKKSEEVQIMGRSARQGQVGSYSQVLLDQQIQKIIGSDYVEELDLMRKKDNFYERLSHFRQISEDQEYDNRNKFIDQIKKDHEEGQKFVQAIIDQDEPAIKEFLKNKNKGANDIPNLIRILCLVDGTASMGALLNKAKTTIKEMFERSCLIIKKSGKNIPEDCFQLQFAVYRDYDMKEQVLQASPWESKFTNLLTFLEAIEPEGGDDYEEAVEVGLQHANLQHANQELSAIILIADAPSKSMAQIKAYREKYGGESFWKTTKQSEITDYTQEMKKLKNSKIPVHCFYLHRGARENFKEIASFTGGKCEELDINSEEASSKLIKVVVEPILLNVGQQNGLGDNLYKEYLKLFDKSYK
ncbi:hypothetical protein ABPG74_002080 [Tetrahymena malaccensis]